MAERVLNRVHSLRERLDETLITQRNEILALLSRYLIQILCFYNFFLDHGLATVKMATRKTRSLTAK